MRFGVKISDVAEVANLAQSTFAAANKACGEHDELAKAITKLHLTLGNLRSEVENPNSVVNKHTGGRRKDLEIHISGCRTHLKHISSMLERRGRHRSESRAMRKRVPSGILSVKEITECQLMVSTYATVIALTLGLLSLGSKGKAERELNNQQGEAKGLRLSINMLLAKQMAGTPEEAKHKSVRSAAHNERGEWRNLRRELVKQGFGSNIVHANKNIIKAYVKELVDRSLLEERDCVQPKTNSFETGHRADSEPTVFNSNYRQPTAEDPDSLSIDTRSSKSSADEPYQAEPEQRVFALPESTGKLELAGVADSGNDRSIAEDQARGSDLVASPVPLIVYQQPFAAYRSVLQRTGLADTIQHSRQFSPQRRMPLQVVDSNITIPVFQTRGPPEFVDFQSSQTQNSGIWDESATENPLPERCECYECMAAPTATINSSTSYGWQQENSERLQDASRPKRRAPSTVYHESQNGSSKGSYSPPAPKEQKKAPLLSLLLFPRMRKATNTATAFVELPQKVPQPRKRQKRAPRPTPPPRPVSPTPPPPEWWLEERLRRRPPGFERGRSPTPRDAEDPVYSRGIDVYSDVLYNGWNTFSYNS